MGLRVMGTRADEHVKVGQRRRLHRLINEYATHSCSDPHDYVYALLSLDKYAQRHIFPDYEKSTADLFEKVAKCFLLQELRNNVSEPSGSGDRVIVPAGEILE